MCAAVKPKMAAVVDPGKMLESFEKYNPCYFSIFRLYYTILYYTILYYTSHSSPEWSSSSGFLADHYYEVPGIIYYCCCGDRS